MNPTLVLLLALPAPTFQDPAPAPQTPQLAPQTPQLAPQAPPQTPPQTPQLAPQPAPQKPSRSREDRLEQRVTPEQNGKPAPEGAPTAEASPASGNPPSAGEAPPAPKEAPPPEDPLAGWQRMNAAAVIVNEELVTNFELQRGVLRREAARTRGNVDRNEMFTQEVVDRARIMLERQAGKDVGFDPERVDRFVDAKMKEDVENSGSITQFAAELKQEGLDSFERKEEYYARVHRLLWEESVTGRGPSPGGRVSTDAYVRPGFALFVQREAARRQSDTRSVMATQMVAATEGPDGDERARRRLADLRARVENGEDMGEVAEQAGVCAPGTKGRTGFLSLANLRDINPAVAKFLDTAAVGELSPVLEFLVDGKPAGYIVVRAEEFKVTPVPPFDDPAAQRNWIRSQEDRAADVRIQVGLGRLLEAAYVWPPTLFPKR